MELIYEMKNVNFLRFFVTMKRNYVKKKELRVKNKARKGENS